MFRFYRAKDIKEFNFDADETTHTGIPVSLKGVSSAFFVFPAALNGRTVTIKSSIPGDTGFTLNATTGRVNLSSDQALALAPMADAIMSVNTAPTEAATVYMACLDS